MISRIINSVTLEKGKAMGNNISRTGTVIIIIIVVLIIVGLTTISETHIMMRLLIILIRWVIKDIILVSLLGMVME